MPTIKYKRGDSVSLQSPSFVSSDNSCKMALYYAIWGTNDVGTISVHALHDLGDEMLWSVVGDGQTVSAHLSSCILEVNHLILI